MITFNYKDKFVALEIGNQVRNKKNIDLATVNEIFNENVYRVNEEMLKDAEVVVDLGANIGAFTVLAGILGAKKIYSIEPNPENIKYLKSNIYNNNIETKVLISENAILDTKGIYEMRDQDRDTHIIKLEDLESDYSRELTPSKEGTFEANAITLEKFFENNDLKEVDVLKCDIEWSEYPIFTNASKETLDKIKYLTMEFHGTDEETFGKLLASLTRSFSVETLGDFKRGGQIYARHY